MIKKNKIATLVKSRKCLASKVTADGTQWIGDGSSFYILAGIKPMEQGGLMSMLDFTDKDVETVHFTSTNVSDNMFADKDECDEQAEKAPKRVIISGAEYLMFETSTRLIFINSLYFKPIMTDEQTTFHIRKDCLCIKHGLLLEAVIAGCSFSEDELFKWFDELNETMCAVSEKYINKWYKDEQPEQLELADE